MILFYFLYLKLWSNKKCLSIVLALKKIIVRHEKRRRKFVVGKPEVTRNSDTFIQAVLRTIMGFYSKFLWQEGYVLKPDLLLHLVSRF